MAPLGDSEWVTCPLRFQPLTHSFYRFLMGGWLLWARRGLGLQRWTAQTASALTELTAWGETGADGIIALSNAWAPWSEEAQFFESLKQRSWPRPQEGMQGPGRVLCTEVALKLRPEVWVRFFFFAVPRGLWDLSSSTRDCTRAPCNGSAES